MKNKQSFVSLMVIGSLVMSIVGNIITPVAYADAPIRNFSASIAPTSAAASQTQSYTVTITNSAGSNEDMKSASVQIPAGWSVSSPTIVLGGGARAGWTFTVEGSLIKIGKTNVGSAIVPGSSMTVGFSATAPNAPGTGEWTIRAFKNDSVPEGGGAEFNQIGNEPSVTVSAPVVTDVCPNLEGNQATVPGGYELSEGQCVLIVVPPTDVCPNLEGDQATVPNGYELTEGNCTLISVPPTDVCPNLEGNQETVPNGYELADDICRLIPEQPVTTGSVQVCKLIADLNGNAIKAGDEVVLPQGAFLISGMTPAVSSNGAPVGQFGSYGFDVPLAYNADLLGNDGVFDAECYTFDKLAFGGYYYDRETGAPSLNWKAPKYNDQFTLSLSTIADVFWYDGNLYDGNPANDGERNENSDGHIMLTSERPNRTLVVVNQAADPNSCELTRHEVAEVSRTDTNITYGILTEFRSPGDGTLRVQGFNDVVTDSGVRYDFTIARGSTDAHVPYTWDATPECHREGSLYAPGTSEGATEQTLEQCSDSTDNDGDSFTDIADADCAEFMPKLIVVKNVINDNGGTAVAGDFTMNAWGENTGLISFPGNAVGTALAIPPGSYGVNEGYPGPYDPTFSLNCNGSIAIGETKTCVITNNDQPGNGPVEPDPENNMQRCTDQFDNDNDGLVDAADPDCEPFVDDEEGGGDVNPPVQPPSGGGGGGLRLEEGSYCTNGIDDDGDYLIDAADPQCAPSGQVLGASAEASGAGDGEVLGASTCAPLIKEYLRINRKNNADEVKKLQQFLNDHMQAGLEVTGFFGPKTFAAVSAFQVKYSDEVLKPWMPFGLGEKESTGYVFKTTKRWINNLYCTESNEPMPQLP